MTRLVDEFLDVNTHRATVVRGAASPGFRYAALLARALPAGARRVHDACSRAALVEQLGMHARVLPTLLPELSSGPQTNTPDPP